MDKNNLSLIKRMKKEPEIELARVREECQTINDQQMAQLMDAFNRREAPQAATEMMEVEKAIIIEIDDEDDSAKKN